MRILVAEDNPDSLESLALLLEHGGHQVCRAPDGQCALEAAESFQPDAVILDIGMPRLGGYAVARHIRAQDWGQATLLIAHTSWGGEEYKIKALEAGFDFHVTKPVPIDVLNRLLEKKVRPRPS